MSIARIVLSILMTLSVIAGVALAGDTQTVSVNVDSSLIRPPEFPTLDDAAKITEPRVVRRFPEVGFQIGGGIGFFNNDKLNDSFGRAESEYGIWQKRGFGTTQLSPEIGVRLFFTPQLMALFQWTYGGDPGGGSFRYSLVSSNLLFAPISSKSAFLFFGAGVGHYELKAKRNYSQSVEGNGTLTDMSLSDVGATAIPLLALFEYRPLESPNYSLFLSARYIPTKSIAFNMPLWGKSNTEVGITVDLGGFWISAGFSYGI